MADRNDRNISNCPKMPPKASAMPAMPATSVVTLLPLSSRPSMTAKPRPAEYTLLAFTVQADSTRARSPTAGRPMEFMSTATSPSPVTMAKAAAQASATRAAGSTPTTQDSTASRRVREKRAMSPAVNPAKANSPMARFTPVRKPMASAGAGAKATRGPTPPSPAKDAATP